MFNTSRFGTPSPLLLLPLGLMASLGARVANPNPLSVRVKPVLAAKEREAPLEHLLLKPDEVSFSEDPETEHEDGPLEVKKGIETRASELVSELLLGDKDSPVESRWAQHVTVTDCGLQAGCPINSAPLYSSGAASAEATGGVKLNFISNDRHDLSAGGRFKLVLDEKKGLNCANTSGGVTYEYKPLGSFGFMSVGKPDFTSATAASSGFLGLYGGTAFDSCSYHERAQYWVIKPLTKYKDTFQFGFQTPNFLSAWGRAPLEEASKEKDSDSSPDLSQGGIDQFRMRLQGSPLGRYPLGVHLGCNLPRGVKVQLSGGSVFDGWGGNEAFEWNRAFGSKSVRIDEGFKPQTPPSHPWCLFGGFQWKPEFLSSSFRKFGVKELGAGISGGYACSSYYYGAQMADKIDKAFDTGKPFLPILVGKQLALDGAFRIGFNSNRAFSIRNWAFLSFEFGSALQKGLQPFFNFNEDSAVGQALKSRMDKDCWFSHRSPVALNLGTKLFRGFQVLFGVVYHRRSCPILSQLLTMDAALPESYWGQNILVKEDSKGEAKTLRASTLADRVLFNFQIKLL